MLIGHRYWLTREDFLTRFVWTGRAGVGDLRLAIVDWPAVVASLNTGLLPCGSCEGQVLRIAASLAGTTTIDLRRQLHGLDAATITLITSALEYAAGQRRGSMVEWGQH